MLQGEPIKGFRAGCYSYGKEASGRKPFISSPCNMRFGPDIARHCRHHLATFFRSMQDEPARWLTMVSDDERYDNLSKLLGLSYKKIFLPLMLQCGLVKQNVSKRWKTVQLVPCVEGGGHYYSSSYSWSNFIAEYLLNIEISYVHLDSSSKKTYFIRIGSFSAGKCFTALDQIHAGMKFKYTTIRDHQRILVEAIAREEISLLSSCSRLSSSTTTNTATQSETGNPSEQYSQSTSINIKNILQTHFFEKILKEGVDINKIWSLVDERKLHDGITELIREVQRSKQERQNECLHQIDDTVKITPVDCDVTKYPALCQFAVPLVNTSIHALLRDIVAFHDRYPGLNLLTFQAFNGKPCTLVNPISSSSYKLFKQNVQRSKWMESLLCGICNNEEEAAEWMMHFLGKKYENKFIEVAVHLGLLLPSKVMDAESACAMWEEANCPYKSQRVILRHLKNFFGRRITVPERFLRELEEGVLNPISGEKVIDGKTVFFWHKKIDEVVAHRVKLELKYHGQNFMAQYDYLDVILAVTTALVGLEQ